MRAVTILRRVFCHQLFHVVKVLHDAVGRLSISYVVDGDYRDDLQSIGLVQVQLVKSIGQVMYAATHNGLKLKIFNYLKSSNFPDVVHYRVLSDSTTLLGM